MNATAKPKIGPNKVLVTWRKRLVGGCRNRKLSALIEEVLSNPEYRQNANNMKQVIAKTNGLEKAVGLLELAFNLAPSSLPERVLQ
jgi:hypothetical protein